MTTNPQIEVARITPDLEREIQRKELVSSDPGVLPLVYDYSMMSTMASCPRKGFLGYVMHLKPKKFEQPRTAGSALHLGTETLRRYQLRARLWRQAGAGDESLTMEQEKEIIRSATLQAFVESAITDPDLPRLIADEEKYKPRSIERLHNLLAKYIEECPFDNPLWVIESEDDIEAGFAILIGEFIFVGRMDLIVRLKKSRKVCILDYKSTTKMTKHYGAQWNPHNQLTGYMAAASHLKGEKVRNGMIDCLYFNKNIEEVGHLFPTTRTDEDIEEWEEEVERVMWWIKGMHEEWQQRARRGGKAIVDETTGEITWKTNDLDEIDLSLSNRAITSFPKNTTHCNFWRKPCTYAAICSAGKAQMRDLIAEGDFVRQPWLPFEELGKRGIGVSDE